MTTATRRRASSRSTSARAPGDSELEVGQTIEAKYRGKKKYYPGKIAARSGDTYDIDYDDGEKESGVARNLIREA